MNTIDIDQLVQKVMSDLGIESAGGSPAAAVPPAESKPVSPDKVPENSSVLRLTSRVITLEQIKQHTLNKGQIHQVIVPVNAVLTPSVRDEVKKQGWSLEFDSSLPSKGSGAAPAADSGLFTMSASNLGRAAVSHSSFLRGNDSFRLQKREGALPSSLGKLVLAFHALPAETIPPSYTDYLRKSFPVEVYQNKCIAASAEYLADVLLSSENKSVLITKYGAIASAVCNRQTPIRAVIGTEPIQMEKDAVSLGANLLIIDSGAGFFRIRQMVNRFVSLGAAFCPSIIQKGLEG